MAQSLPDRLFGAIEFLAGAGEGAPLQALADRIGAPKSAAHRLMQELIRLGYVRQDPDSGRYGLTTRLAQLAFRHLAACGTLDAAQPVLDRLAGQAGELVRLSVTEGTAQVWVARAQGAGPGLRHDPPPGGTAAPASTAAGLAWLACLGEAEALGIATAAGLGTDPGAGPGAPRDLAALRAALEEAQQEGHAALIDGTAPGVSGIAAAIAHPATGAVLGTLSVEGPTVRLTPARMAALAPALLAAANEIARMAAGSALLGSRARRGPGG